MAAAAACGGDGSTERTPSGDDIGIEARPDAAGGDTDEATAAQDAVEQLLVEHDRLVNEIVAEPAAATRADDPRVAAYAALFEPDSPAVERTTAAWAAMAAEGRTTVPADAAQPAFASRLDGEVELVDEDEVRFPTCDRRSYAVVDRDGMPVEVQQLVEVPGEGTAVLVDGAWRLRDLTLQAASGCGED